MPEKVHVVHHGVSLSLFDGNRNRAAPESAQTLSRYGLVSGNYLLYVSALWRYKNQDKLIGAHAEIVKQGFPDLKLVLAGKGTGTETAYIDKLHSRTNSLGTNDLVVFTGGLDQITLAHLYAHARAFVFPSSYESFGNPIFEAWASGVPVVAANVHSSPEIVGEAGLLFGTEDGFEQADITSAVLQVLRDAPLARELTRRGALRAKDFTWKTCLARTLRVLEDVKGQI